MKIVPARYRHKPNYRIELKNRDREYGQLLKEIRQKLGKSKLEVGISCGFKAKDAINLVDRIETGYSPLTIHRLSAYVKGLGFKLKISFVPLRKTED